SLARTEHYRSVFEKVGLSDDGVPAKDMLKTLYLSGVSAARVKQCVRELYAVERTERKAREGTLLAELIKLRVFDWGGVHQNDINGHIVDNYVKKIINYDELVDKVESEIL